MISKTKIKLIHSLALKKNRMAQHAFVAEGPKVVGSLLAEGYLPLFLAATEHCALSSSHGEHIVVSPDELKKISFLQHPQEILGVFHMPGQDTEQRQFIPPLPELSLALDGVQDPGNLGTIIRIADWFGIQHIFCSPDTADAYNPKVIQATMGSIARVKFHYTSLPEFLASIPEEYPIYGTLLDGDDLYQQPLTGKGILVMGNEGNGISPQVRPFINRRLYIPNYSKGTTTAESLNVAVATAITVAEFKRRTLPND